MSKYSEELFEKYPDTEIIRSHTKSLKRQEEIHRDMKQADMNITKLCKDF